MTRGDPGARILRQRGQRRVLLEVPQLGVWTALGQCQLQRAEVSGACVTYLVESHDLAGDLVEVGGHILEQRGAVGHLRTLPIDRYQKLSSVGVDGRPGCHGMCRT